MKKALITGIAGFAGSHLAEHLLSKNIKVFGVILPGHSTENVDHLKNELSIIPCDILIRSKTKKTIKEINPDLVFHLAALASPAQSFDSAREVLENNILGQLNLLESLHQIKSKARILIIGSADEYGLIAKKYLPANENTPLLPISPYAVSKVAQDMLGYQFFLQHNLHIVRVRPFNHIGPGQSTSFAIPSFAAQIAKLEKQGKGEILVGNLQNIRDFTDVRDTMKAYLLALEKCIPGEVYNIGSGKPVKIAAILKTMLAFSKAKITIREDKSRLPPLDIQAIYCTYSKFRSQTGWQPKIPLKVTLFDTMEYERNKLR